MNSNNTANNAVAVIAVHHSARFQPEPPPWWALVRDATCKWHLESEMRLRLDWLGLDSDLDHYTLYAVPRNEYHPRDLNALRIGNQRDDVVHRETVCDDDTVAAVREAARRRAEVLPAR